MKTLYLFRHGDAENIQDSDYSRKLTEEGRKQTQIIGEHLKSSEAAVNKIISSGAPRAYSTAEIIAREILYPVADIEIDDIIYDAKTGDEIIPLIQKTKDDISSLMIVGHIPVLNDLATFLNKDSKKIDMGKSSVVRIDFELDNWLDVNHGAGNLIYYKKPVNGGIETVN